MKINDQTLPFLRKESVRTFFENMGNKISVSVCVVRNAAGPICVSVCVTGAGEENKFTG